MLELLLTIEGPFLTSGLDQNGHRLDATRARGADAKPTVPWSHLRGHLREAVVELLCSHKPELPVARAERAASCLFGAPDDKGARGTRNAILPRSIKLTSAGSEADTPAQTSWNVSIDAFRGAARDSHLTVRETGQVGDVHTLSVAFDIAAIDGLTKSDAERVLLAASLWMRGFGKGAQSGWGRITERKVTLHGAAIVKTDLDGHLAALPAALDALLAAAPAGGPKVSPKAGTTQRATTPGHLDLTIKLNGPLVIGDGRRGSNVIPTRTDIPGSVLRRALADVLLGAAGKPPGGWVDPALTFTGAAHGLTPVELTSIAADFNKIHISFGIPVDHTGQPASVAPLSTFGSVDRWADLVRGDHAALDPKDHILDAPIQTITGQGFVRTRLHAHVAKDRSTGAARHGMLFLNRAVAERWQVDVKRPDPPAEGKDSETETIKFDATFTARVTAPADLIEPLRRLLPAVTRLGKAIGRGYGLVSVTTKDSELPAPTKLTARTVRLTVETEALWLRRSEVQLSGTLENVYSAALSEMLGVTVQVTHVFAHHRLRGGVTAGGPGAVPPAILTLPGSALRVTWDAAHDLGARAALADAERFGLQRQSELDDLEQAWQRLCPFRTDNGYGRVRIDTPKE